MTIKTLVSEHYNELTKGLQQAADYIVDNPIAVATQSLRSIASASGLSPTTFSRLSRALGLESHDEVRALCSKALSTPSDSFAEKAHQLKAASQTEKGLGELFYAQALANENNLQQLVNEFDAEKAERVVERLATARQVYLLGTGVSRSLTRYLHETTSWFTDNWRLVNDSNRAMSNTIIAADPDDVIFLISKSLYSKMPIRLAQLAAEKGCYVVLVTDSHTCPALSFADDSFVLSLDSPYFFSSYVPTLMLLESLMGMLVARLGDKAEKRISATEVTNRDLGIY